MDGFPRRRHAAGNRRDGPGRGLLEKLNAVASRPYEVAAAIARYEPRGSAARRLLDAAAGVFFEDPNDLVVPTEGGARLGAAPPVPEEDVIRFGPGGNAGAGAARSFTI